ncbi:hypothetical protein NVP1055O_27 [Vibrio phage 1.055.O._10N.286.55.E9]|nr:hypothetical protein NVP1055O_27 [Vibrio phage 1.055.O._10N.286.55.E9]
MASPVTVFRSTDDGAPQLDATPISMFNVIKACLIDGYGGKSPLGWSILFEDLTRGMVVLENATNSGVVRFSCENDAPDVTNGDTIIQVAKSASDVDTLIGTLPLLNRASSSSGIWWEIIGTDRGCHIIRHYSAHDDMYTSTSSAHWHVFIGDIDCYNANDAGRFTMVTGALVGNDNSSTSSSYSIGGSSIQSCELHDTDGVIHYEAYSSTATSWEYATSSATYNRNDIDSTNFELVLTPCVLNNNARTGTDRNGTLTLVSDVAPYVRGIVTGLYRMSIGSYHDGTPWPIDRTFNGLPYTKVRGANAGLLWIKTDEWY